jgi:DNA repair exonuclease SbcCD ATPase subunit
MRAVRLKINLILSLALVLIGCLHTMNSAKTPVSSTSPPAAENNYSRKMLKLKNVVQQNSNAAETKKAHLELARLYLNHKNPQRNYQKAYAHLRIYVANAEVSVSEETLNWMAALKEIDLLSEKIACLSEEIMQVKKELEKSNEAALAVQRSNQKLSREEIMLREKNRKLEESNQKLEKTIEMLQNLDQRLEEKRKNFTN